ncbi:hypothetical protein PGT21_000740 [Puccinia graminis f. sp. tritici]|uniref:Uncharacterized protein n=1 Tax=Puccinia graminis f. sp. tritici TaxID=56615 RepID=A0A5B0MFK1_PUCGR|nr:hypothetical protein PGT21_000740 [Puccinia graminis f. sp. tritici]
MLFNHPVLLFGLVPVLGTIAANSPCPEGFSVICLANDALSGTATQLDAKVAVNSNGKLQCPDGYNLRNKYRYCCPQDITKEVTGQTKRGSNVQL